MMSRSRPGRVRCALGCILVPALGYALVSSLGACDYVAYLGDYKVTDGKVDDAAPDAPTDVDASVPCGPKTCVAPATCLDPAGPGKCSNDIVSISAGGESTCAVIANGTLWCWGGNQLGTLGMPSDGDDRCKSNGVSVGCRFKPLQVPGLEDVVQVSVGYQSTCAVKRDNSVWCWGLNSYGQLGHAPGSSGDRVCPSTVDGDAGSGQQCNAVPTRVEGLAAVEVAINLEHACAIGLNGFVSCWGRNEAMALGTSLIATFTPTPQAVNMPQAVHLATGILSYHTCAITKAGGQVWCWGANHSGQLGHPKSSDTECSGNCSSKPSAVTMGSPDASPPQLFDNVTSLAAGYLYTCAVRESRAYCWGGANFGTLGSSNNADSSSSPVFISRLPFVREVSTRFQHVCALTEDGGKVYCWGANLLGSIGTGNILGEQRCISTSSCWTTPYNTGISDAVGVAAGGATGFALFNRGLTVSAWGDNSTARLGHAPESEGDFLDCGDNRNSVCNPNPRTVTPFP